MFARRPSNWAAVVDRGTGRVRLVVTTPPERHFFGHGVFSPDGRLLYATENRAGIDDPDAGAGVLGIYDAGAGYRRVGERPTHGSGRTISPGCPAPKVAGCWSPTAVRARSPAPAARS